MSSAAPRRRWMVWPWVLLAGAVAFWWWSPGSSLLPDGSRAPALSVPIDPGGTFRLADARGHVTVLVFWATWCPACRQEGRVLSAVHERIRAHGDSVVGVSVDDAPLGAVRAAASRLAMVYPIALGNRADADHYRVQLLPTAYVVGPDGTIASSFAGATGESELLAAVEQARTR